ncbi:MULTISPECIES: zf-TFIIB domain-containing protein [unclassified Nocardioides]|uniref:TFIIB-type zinc ribbon-containing protein n=1 Tax=unclassified Nocardioides TaxID=2615069 RepID=UPI00362225C1
MQCPTDGTTLVMSERSGIEIDYCPTCRGVWLDRGELDKIIDRSLGQQAPPAAPPPQQQQQQQPHYQQQQQYQQPYQQGGYYKKKRKESWLSEIFD